MSLIYGMELQQMFFPVVYLFDSQLHTVLDF